MTYEVLARKWRPGNFQDLVGQEHVVRALVNALDSDRIHHAFLFTGTRGVGKTTIARILSKALNCEQGVSSKPCGTCSACTEIDEGRFLDLIEVDAASRTKVDDTRELLDNVQYAPSRGRYKVYLIDEVHMLSGHSFNALLKTLEEPPPHVKFLLATTDPQKLPVTVLSRCLQFSLKRLSREQISGQLKTILESEKIKSDAGSIDAIARAADGSMRDGLSLLDQAISFGAGELLVNDVTDMLGTIDPQGVDNMLDALQDQNADTLMAAVASLVQIGGDYSQIIDALLLRLHEIALAQTDKKLVSDSAGNMDKLLKFADEMPAADVQLYYQIALHGKRDLPLAPDPRTGLEMMALRLLTFQPVAESKPVTNQSVPKTEPAAVSNKQPASTSTSQQPAPAVTASAVTNTASEASPAAAIAPETSKNITQNITMDSPWTDIVNALQISPLVKQLCSNAAMQKDSTFDVSLVLDQSHGQLLNKDRELELKKAMESLWGKTIKLKIELGKPSNDTPAATKKKELDSKQHAAETAINKDENIQALQESFGATIKPGSVRSRV